MALTSRTNVVVFSLIVHGAIAVGVGQIRVNESHAATAIEMTESKKHAEKTPPKAEPPPEKAAPKAHAKAAPLPEQDAPPPASMDELPDFGLSLGGGVEGDGIALPVAGVGPRTPTATAVTPTVKKLVSSAPKAAPAEGDGCTEPATKPRPRSVPQPAYTEDARAAGIQGKVRVQLTVDETGQVVDVKLVAGLGHGLDEIAIAAARKATFEPALRCGKPTRATFNISMRFNLE
jgi:periplasmic protein TonB